ncbi:sulfate adenylyltransferase [Candidatus Omnitrophota bacterium]
MRTVGLKISDESWVEACNIANGSFFPLKGFMDSADYMSVVKNMHLDNGSPWTLPITLEVPEKVVKKILTCKKIDLINSVNEHVAELYTEDVYKVDNGKDIKKLFGTNTAAHPGIKKELSKSPFRVGGSVKILKFEDSFKSRFYSSPERSKRIFKQKGWKTITGFQTRNPLHRAHEYLQRIALEVTDGLFIHPVIGWKKTDDFSPTSIIKAYEKMVKEFYSKKRVVLSVLKIPMRYAGPREAVFHALVRRNFGCTHFIVGRDHAGVGGYYGKYDAHKLCQDFNDLGIKILALNGPYFCRRCGTIVTEKSCPHGEKDALSISGTQIRQMLRENTRPPEEYMRKEVADVLIGLQKKKELFL